MLSSYPRDKKRHRIDVVGICLFVSVTALCGTHLGAVRANEHWLGSDTPSRVLLRWWGAKSGLAKSTTIPLVYVERAEEDGENGTSVSMGSLKGWRI